MGPSTPPPCLCSSQTRFLRPLNYHLSHVLFREAAQSHKTYQPRSPTNSSTRSTHQLSGFIQLARRLWQPLHDPSSSFPPTPCLHTPPLPLSSVLTLQSADSSSDIEAPPAVGSTHLGLSRRAPPALGRSPASPPARPAMLRPLRPAAPAAPAAPLASLRAPASGSRRGGRCMTPTRHGAGRHKPRPTGCSHSRFRGAGPGALPTASIPGERNQVWGGPRGSRAGIAHSACIYSPRWPAATPPEDSGQGKLMSPPMS